MDIKNYSNLKYFKCENWGYAITYPGTHSLLAA